MDELRELEINPTQRLEVWRDADGRLRARLRGRVEVHCGRGKIHPDQKIDFESSTWDDLCQDELKAALSGDIEVARVFAHGLRMTWMQSWRDPCERRASKKSGWRRQR